MAKEKSIIVYLPNESEQMFCTKDLGSDFKKVSSIDITEDDSVQIMYVEDDKLCTRYYCGMPYVLEIFGE